MVKLTFTIAAVVAAAAVVADVVASQPDSTHHGSFLRQAGPTRTGMGNFDPAGSSMEDVPPLPRDSSSSVHRDHAGSFRAGDRPPPLAAGSLGGRFDVVGHNDGGVWQGNGSLDDRYPPSPDPSSSSSSSWVPSPPDTDRDDQGDRSPFSDRDHGGVHRKALRMEVRGPDGQNPPPPMSSRPVDGPNHGMQGDEPSGDDHPDEGRPPSKHDNPSNDDNKPNGDDEPFPGDKPLSGDMDQPSDDKRIDGQREPSSGRGDRDKFPDDRDGGVRAHHDRPLDEGSWRGDGSVDGRFLPPPHAGSDGQQPVVGGGRVVDAPTNHDKPGDPESPASRAGSSSLSPSHDVGAGYGEVPQNDGKAQ